MRSRLPLCICAYVQLLHHRGTEGTENHNCFLKGARRNRLARHTPKNMQWQFSVSSVPLW